MSDEVDHPSHYGGDTDYEVIKVLRAWDLDLAKGFCWGNCIKYQARAGKKGSAIQDRKKAAWYADELTSIETELAGREQHEQCETLADDQIYPFYGRVSAVTINWRHRTVTPVVGNGGMGTNTLHTDGGHGGGYDA